MGPNMGAINTTAHKCLTQFTGIGAHISTHLHKIGLHMLTISHRILNNSSISEAAFQ